MFIEADASGVAVGTLLDPVITLSGPTSVLGRAMIIHGSGQNVTGAATVRVAQCVIGMVGPNEPVMTATPAAPTIKPVMARCDVRGGVNGPSVGGTFRFLENAKGDVQVSYNLFGLSAGNHGYHVHQAGDLRTSAATATLAHFNGTCPFTATCRVNATLRETGNIDDGAPLVADSNGNAARSWFTDSVLKLSGADSILGRAIVIHGNAGSTTARVAQCVVGVAMDVPVKVPNVPSVATCKPVVPNTGVSLGTIRFSSSPENVLRTHFQLLNLPSLGAYTNVAIKRFPGDTVVNSDIYVFPATLALTASATGTFDKYFDAPGLNVSLSGPMGVLGRTLIMTGGATLPAVECVIGANEANDPTTSASPGVALSPVPGSLITMATCQISRLNPYSSAVSGKVTFNRTSTDSLKITVSLSGLDASADVSQHVHQTGSLESPTYTDTLGHFLGACSAASPCRPIQTPPILQEIGNLNNGQYVKSTATNTLDLSFSDIGGPDGVTFDGYNSIIGRTVVIHQPTALLPSRRVAQCVIAVAGEGVVTCQRGYYQLTADSGCLPCPKGTYSAADGTVGACTACSIESFSNTTASTACYLCPKNSRISGTGQGGTSINQCSCISGYVFNADQTACISATPPKNNSTASAVALPAALSLAIVITPLLLL